MNKRNFFDRIAPSWHDEHQNPEERFKLEALFRHIPMAPGNRVLDAGCGTGRVAPLIRKSVGDSGWVVGMDLAWEMLNIAGKQQRGKCIYVLSDAHEIALLDGQFDVVICFALFPHLKEKLRALEEFRRVLNPGGQLVVAHTMNREELNAFHARVKGPVTSDLLPKPADMAHFFETVGFRDFSLQEEPSLYIARGWK